MPFIIQKGYVRTGTNYSRVVLENNFNCLVITAEKHDDKEDICDNTPMLLEQVKRHKGWPHNITPEVLSVANENNMLKYIVCIRNPFSWLYGAWRQAPSRHCPDPSNPWKAVEDYNNRYRAWSNIIKENEQDALFIRHEDMLDNFELTMEHIHKKFNLQKKYDKYVNEKRDVLGQHKGKKRVSKNAYTREHNFYKMPLDKDGSPEYSEELFCKAREMVDWDVMDFYGYSCYNTTYGELHKK